MPPGRAACCLACLATLASAAASPVPANLTPARGRGPTLAYLLAVREQRRHRRPLKRRRDGGAQILEHRTPLRRAGGNDRPDPLTPAAAGFPMRPLRHLAINH